MNTDTRITPYPLRIDPEIRARIEALAKANGRSLNAEIAMRLDLSLKPDPDPVRLDQEFRTKLEADAKIAGIKSNMLDLQTEHQVIAYLQEKDRQQREESKRQPAPNTDESVEEDTKTTNKSSIFNTDFERHLKKQEQQRLQSETDFERLVRKAVGAVELRKLGSQLSGADSFKISPTSMGLPRPLMDSSDVTTALEGTVLRTICTVLNDVVKDLIVEVVHQELAKAGITLSPNEQIQEEKGEIEEKG